MNNILVVSRALKKEHAINNYYKEIKIIRDLFEKHNIKEYSFQTKSYKKNATNLIVTFVNHNGEKYTFSSRVFYSPTLGLATQRGATLYKVLKILGQA